MPTDALWFRILVVAAAGAVGALARWGTSAAVVAITGRPVPWNFGTLSVNVLGCFVLGTIAAAVEPRSATGLAIVTGFLGAYTTFSAFAFDTHLLIVERGLLAATLNVTLHVGLGLIALVLGIALGRVLF
jgi:CrcB protein